MGNTQPSGKEKSSASHKFLLLNVVWDVLQGLLSTKLCPSPVCPPLTRESSSSILRRLGVGMCCLTEKHGQDFHHPHACPCVLHSSILVALQLFKSYLSNRNQYVHIDKCKSQSRPIACGVP